MTLLKRLELLRNYRSLRLLARAIEDVSSIHLGLLDAGVEPPKVKLLPWSIAKYTPAGRRLYLRVWGSPPELTPVVEASLVAVKAAISADIGNLGPTYRKAIAFAICAETVSRVGVRERAQRAILGEDEVSVEAVIVSESAKETGLKRVIELAVDSAGSRHADEVFSARLRRSSETAHRLYKSAELFSSRRELFERIPIEQSQKPEFLRVIARQGHGDLQELRSMYSLLLALVYRNPGKTVGFYHRERLEERPERGFVSVEAVAQELAQLEKLGIIMKLYHHYYPFDYVRRFEESGLS